MGRAWSCVGIGLALLGCTHPNPAYDSGVEDTDLGTQGSPSSGGGVTSTLVTTGSDDVADSGSGKGDGGSTTTGETSDTSPGCVFEETPRYRILRGESPLGCEPPLFDRQDFGLQLETAEMFTVFGNSCPECPCSEAGGPLTLTFDAQLPFIPISAENPVCLTIARAMSETGCELQGYTVTTDDFGGMGEDQIIAAASNELQPGEGVPFVGEFLEPLDQCMETCRGDDPAHYVLELASEMSTVEMYPDAMALVDGLDVHNAASYVGPDCIGVMRWYALRPP